MNAVNREPGAATARGITVVEIVGIPYAGKTTLARELARYLKSQDISYEILPEDRTSRDFYDKRKLSFDVNYLRSLSIARSLVISCFEQRVKVIIVDRGIVDTMAWYSFFAERGGTTCDAKPALDFVLCDLLHRVEKYAVVWINPDPVSSTMRHPGGPGRIVNLPSVTSLSRKYGDTFKELPSSICSLEFGDMENAPRVAQKVANALKLAKFTPR